MSYSHNPFVVQQLAEHADPDCKAESLYYDESSDAIRLDASMISSAMERRDSFTTSNYTSFSPPASANQWSDEAYSIASSTANGAHADQPLGMSSHLNDSSLASNDSFAIHNHQIQWHSPTYDTIIDAKPTLHIASYDFAPINHSGAASYASAVPRVTEALNKTSDEMRTTSIMASCASSDAIPFSSRSSTGREWMLLAEQDADTNRLPNRMRQKSPHRPLSPGSARGDGVRKKNARFEIPEGRSLRNIDQLIAQANAQGQEEDVKELKQQKRLLRNRQAALDSRQRKKKHTEDLEKEQRVWLEDRNDIKAKLDILQEQYDQLQSHNERLQQANIELHAQVHRLTHKNPYRNENKSEEIMLQPTEIDYIRDLHLNGVEKPEQPAATFGSYASDFNHLAINHWHDMMMQGTTDDEDALKGSTSTVNQNSQAPELGSTHLVADKGHDTGRSDDPVTSSAFALMLLLYGAIVASRNTTNGIPPMPGMSDELRLESAKVANKILNAEIAKSMPTLVFADVQSSLDHSVVATAEPQHDNAQKSPHGRDRKVVLPRHSRSRTDSLVLPWHQSSDELSNLADLGSATTQSDYIKSSNHVSHTGWPVNESPLFQTMKQQSTTCEDSANVKTEAEGDAVADIFNDSLVSVRIPEKALRDFRRMADEWKVSNESSRNE